MGWASRANPLARAVKQGGLAVKEDKIKILAQAIRDEAEFDRLVNQARPELRDAVRRHLRPHLRFALKDPDEPEVVFVTLAPVGEATSG